MRGERDTFLFHQIKDNIQFILTNVQDGHRLHPVVGLNSVCSERFHAKRSQTASAWEKINLLVDCRCLFHRLFDTQPVLKIGE